MAFARIAARNAAVIARASGQSSTPWQCSGKDAPAIDDGGYRIARLRGR